MGFRFNFVNLKQFVMANVYMVTHTVWHSVESEGASSTKITFIAKLMKRDKMDFSGIYKL